jgi:FkbM family methyltransferase
LFEYDAYTSLTRFIDRGEPLVVVDVGANEGLTAERVLREFPNAKVHAFEPAPETYKLLQARVASNPQIRTYPLACGSTNGSVDFHVTENHWCSSVLPPSDLGKRYYGDWYATREVVKVPVTTLDDWATRNNVAHVDFLKVDAQGYDLQVLQGAKRLLASGVRAINCECQFAPEYEGCASFSQVDRFLADQGYAIHQVHEVWSKGREEQTSYADALWLRTDVLQALRSRTDLPDVTAKGRVVRALKQAAAAGCRSAALFGSGQHTSRVAPHFDAMPIPVVAIIDDNPDRIGTHVGGRPVIPQSRVAQLGIDAVVLSSDAHEPALWSSSRSLREQGTLVIPLYGSYPDVETACVSAA